jgi:hypothetical protein
MSASWNEKHPKPFTPFWAGVIKFTLFVTLVGLMFLLAESMVEHRFLQGGWVDESGRVR